DVLEREIDAECRRVFVDSLADGGEVGRRLDHGSSSPLKMVTARPPSFTRSPSSRTRTTPPRGDAWYATSSFLPRREAQYGARQQCEEPVTGSSSTPDPGAKKRETKSYS